MLRATGRLFLTIGLVVNRRRAITRSLRIQYSDAFYHEIIDGCRPLIAPHFNLTVKLPLKAIVRGFSWTVIPITWRNRRSGIAKLKIKEMGSRYLFICLYIWLEKYLSRGDYRKR